MVKCGGAVFLPRHMHYERHRNTNWSALFAASRTEADVLRIANEYLATWLPSDLETLPVDCRIPSVGNADELAHAAVTFTQSELHVAPDTPAATVLAALTEVFIAA